MPVAMVAGAKTETPSGGRSYVMGGGRERVGTDIPKNHYELRIIRDPDLNL